MCTGAYLCFVSVMTAAAVTAGDLDILTGVLIDTPWGNSIIEGSRAAKDGQYAAAARVFERALPLISLTDITMSSREDRMDLALAWAGWEIVTPRWGGTQRRSRSTSGLSRCGENSCRAA